MTKPYIVAVDFDGTLCENRYPSIGAPNKRLIRYLLKRKQNGALIVLWTCRGGQSLIDACEWCEKQGLIFDAVNSNPEVAIEYHDGSDPRKIGYDELIDDKINRWRSRPFKRKRWRL